MNKLKVLLFKGSNFYSSGANLELFQFQIKNGTNKTYFLFFC